MRRACEPAPKVVSCSRPSGGNFADAVFLFASTRKTGDDGVWKKIGKVAEDPELVLAVIETFPKAADEFKRLEKEPKI